MIRRWKEEAPAAGDGASSSNTTPGSTADPTARRPPRRRTGLRPRRTLPPASPETQSHNWLEGERVGEARNPGPAPNRSNRHQAPPPPQHTSPNRPPKQTPPSPRGQERREPGQTHGARQAPRGSGPHRKPQPPATEHPTKRGGRGAARHRPTGQQPTSNRGARGSRQHDGRQGLIPRDPDSVPHHTEGRHPHPNAHRHNNPHTHNREGWQTVWPPRERRLRQRIRGLERALEGLVHDLESWRAKRWPPRQQGRGGARHQPRAG